MCSRFVPAAIPPLPTPPYTVECTVPSVHSRSHIAAASALPLPALFRAYWGRAATPFRRMHNIYLLFFYLLCFVAFLPSFLGRFLRQKCFYTAHSHEPAFQAPLRPSFESRHLSISRSLHRFSHQMHHVEVVIAVCMHSHFRISATFCILPAAFLPLFLSQKHQCSNLPIGSSIPGG